MRPLRRVKRGRDWQAVDHRWAIGYFTVFAVAALTAVLILL